MIDIELYDLYKKIIAEQLYAKIEDSGIDWIPNGSSFTTTLEDDGVVWDFLLTSGVSTTMTFTKDGEFFMTLSSEDDPTIEDIYNELYDSIQDVSTLDRDREILSFFGGLTSGMYKTYNHIMSGGIRVAGLGGISFGFVARGGLLLAGNARIFVTFLTRGGVLLAGSSVANQSGSFVVSGGVTGDGSADVDYEPSTFVMSGGVTGDGLADASCVSEIGVSGGCLVSGTAISQLSCNYTASGGVVCAGTSTPSFTYLVSGGCFAAGSATITVRYNHTSTGGMVCAGAAILLLSRNITPTGGCVCSGASTTFVRYSHTSTGGVLCAGIAIESVTTGSISNSCCGTTPLTLHGTVSNITGGCGCAAGSYVFTYNSGSGTWITPDTTCLHVMTLSCSGGNWGLAFSGGLSSVILDLGSTNCTPINLIFHVDGTGGAIPCFGTFDITITS